MSKTRTPKVCGIYIIRRIGTDECYVGQSVDIQHRWRNHRKTLLQGTHRARWLQRAHTKYGPDAFEWVVIEEVLDPSLLTASEQRWMDELNPCYNTSPSAGSVFGLSWPEDSKKAQSARASIRAQTPEGKTHLRQIRLGKEPGIKGRCHTPEAKEKMRLAKLGKPSNRAGKSATEETKSKLRAAWTRTEKKIRHTTPHTEETKAKISASKIGRKASPETRAKMSAARRGKKLGPREPQMK